MSNFEAWDVGKRCESDSSLAPNVSVSQHRCIPYAPRAADRKVSKYRYKWAWIFSQSESSPHSVLPPPLSLIYQANAFYLTVFSSSSSSEQHYTLFPGCSLLLPAHRGCPSFGAPPFSACLSSSSIYTTPPSYLVKPTLRVSARRSTRRPFGTRGASRFSSRCCWLISCHVTGRKGLRRRCSVATETISRRAIRLWRRKTDPRQWVHVSGTRVAMAIVQ
jgi:hypothetical protein